MEELRLVLGGYSAGGHTHTYVVPTIQYYGTVRRGVSRIFIMGYKYIDVGITLDHLLTICLLLP